MVNLVKKEDFLLRDCCELEPKNIKYDKESNLCRFFFTKFWPGYFSLLVISKIKTENCLQKQTIFFFI